MTTAHYTLAGLVHGALSAASPELLAELAGVPAARLALAQMLILTVETVDGMPSLSKREAFMSGMACGTGEILASDGTDRDTALLIGCAAAQRWHSLGTDLPPAEELSGMNREAVADYIAALAAVTLSSAAGRTVH